MFTLFQCLLESLRQNSQNEKNSQIKHVQFFKHFCLRLMGEMVDYWLERLYISMLDDTAVFCPTSVHCPSKFFLLFLGAVPGSQSFSPRLPLPKSLILIFISRHWCNIQPSPLLSYNSLALGKVATLLELLTPLVTRSTSLLEMPWAKYHRIGGLNNRSAFSHSNGG